MSNSVQTIQTPRSIAIKLGQIRAEKARSRLAAWGIGGLAVLLLAMGLAMGVDRMLVLFSPAGGAALTLAALGTVAAVQLAWLAAIARRGLKATELAAEVDNAIPRLEERWSTIAEIAAAPPAHHLQIHRGMMNRLAREATSWEPRVRSAQVVSYRGLVAATAALGVMLALLVAAMVVDPRHTSVLLRRFWSPMSNISTTRIVRPSGDMLVRRNETFTLTCRLEGDRVATATIFRQDDETDDVQCVTLFPSDGNPDQFSYCIKAAEQSFRYRFRAGDGQTDWYRVTIVQRPELAESRLRIVPPAYTKQAPIELKELPQKVSVIEGSRVEIAFTAWRGRQSQVASEPGRLRIVAAGIRPFRNASARRDRLVHPQICAAREPDDLCRAHRRWRTGKPQPAHMFDRRSPRSAADGQHCQSRERYGRRASDTIEVRFRAQDDLAVSKAELVVYGKDPTSQRPVEIDVIPIPLGSQKDAKQIAGSASLDLARYDLREGDAGLCHARLR